MRRSNRTLLSGSEIWHLSSTRTVRSTTKTHCGYSFTKPSTTTFNIVSCCLYNQLQFIYCLPAWVEKYVRSFPSYPHANSLVFSWRMSHAQLRTATQTFCVLIFHSEQSLWALLSRVPPHPLVRWAPFEVLQYQNRANSLKWNVGIMLACIGIQVSHTWTKDENKTHSTKI